MHNLMTPKDAAIALGLKPRRVRDFIHEKRLPAYNISGRWFIELDDLKEFAKIERRAGNPHWVKKDT